MSLAAGSPVHSSSSSDDFATLLEAELDIASDNLSDDEEAIAQEKEEEDDIQYHRAKRQKVENTDLAPQDFENSENITNAICPPHPGFIKGMCIICGQMEEVEDSGVPFSYIHKDLRLGNKEINRLRGKDLSQLLNYKKLILILDLDHTLLNTARFIDLCPEEEYLLHQADSSTGPDRSIYKLPGMHLLTKLRPFLRNFLQEASKLFEMYIYTMGERAYALEIAKIIDPDKVYFDTRVISQGDSTKRHQKGLDVVLGAESAVVILDDTENVWQRHKDNLILMERYHFFSSSCRQFGFSTNTSLSVLKKDESESDGALATVLNVLRRAHEMFFDERLKTQLSSRDVRHMLRNIRNETLKGCNIIFSRVFPSTTEAEDQPIWKMAQRMGAVCRKEKGSEVTHVVSTDKTTEKAKWALKNGKFLVNPRWIEAANYLWSKPEEGDFQVPSSSLKNAVAM